MTAASDETAGAGPVAVSRDRGVATLELAEPETRNAWHPGMDAAYQAALAALADEPEVRVVVLRGRGDHFCVGRRMGGLAAIADGSEPAQQSSGIEATHGFPKPVIASIRGGCAGIGLTLALHCDVRFAAASARFSTAFARLGLPAGHATSWLLQRVVSPADAAELLLSARKVGADEAAELGLVHRTLPDELLDDYVRDYARAMAGEISPRSVAAMKRQLRLDAERGFDAAWDDSRRLADEAFGTDDSVEGVAASRERRPPAFTGLSSGRGAHGRPGAHRSAGEAAPSREDLR